jgi:hypothetical protein
MTDVAVEACPRGSFSMIYNGFHAPHCYDCLDRPDSATPACAAIRRVWARCPKPLAALPSLSGGRGCVESGLDCASAVECALDVRRPVRRLRR